jgi:hypothetical protein
MSDVLDGDAELADAELAAELGRAESHQVTGRDTRWVGPAVGILGLWPIAVVVSVFGFQQQWNHSPDLVSIVMANTLLAPFSLAKSFADTVGLTHPNSLRGVLVAVALFWPLVLTLAALVISKRSRLAFVALTGVVVVAAWKWLVVATGMVGI